LSLSPSALRRLEIIAAVHDESWFDEHLALVVLNHYDGALEHLYAAAMLGRASFLRCLFPNLTLRQIEKMRATWVELYPFFVSGTSH